MLQTSFFKKNKGFTIIELLVVVSVFSFVVFIISSLFISVFKQQRKTLNQQELLNQTSYVIEYIGRALRMAKEDVSAENSCVISGTRNYQITTEAGSGLDYHSGKGIRFLNNSAGGPCQELFWDQTSQMLYESKNAGITSPTFLPLFADYIKIEKFGIVLSETVTSPNYQPRVTISMKVKIGFGSESAEKQIQITTSQRNLNK